MASNYHSLKILTKVGMYLIAAIVLFIFIKNLDLKEQAVSDNTQARLAAQAPPKLVVPAYHIVCGDAIGPDLRDLTNVTKAIFVIPPNCTSGMIFIPNNAKGFEAGAPSAPIVITSCSSRPYSGTSQVPDAANLNLYCATIVDTAVPPGSTAEHIWGIPVALKIKNPQSLSVMVEVTFDQ